MKRIAVTVFAFFIILQGFSSLALSEHDGDADASRSMMLYAEMVAEIGPYESWTIEEKALCDEMRSAIDGTEILCGLPRPDELDENFALEIAKEAVFSDGKYPMELSSQCDIATSFFLLDNENLWVFDFTPPDDYVRYGTYSVEIGATDGEIILCKWYGAVLGPNEETSAQSSNPKGTMPEEDVVSTAMDWVSSEYRITRKALGAFHTFVVYEQEGATWTVYLSSNDEKIHNAFGSYVVGVSDEFGSVLWGEMGGNG